jgi:hypothetical protein
LSIVALLGVGLSVVLLSILLFVVLRGGVVLLLGIIVRSTVVLLFGVVVLRVIGSISVSVVDLGFVEVSVGDVEEHFVPVNWTVEGIAHWVTVDVLRSGTHHGYVSLAVFVWYNFTDHNVELIRYATVRSLWQHESEI